MCISFIALNGLFIIMQELSECLKTFFAPIELPDIGDWHHYHESEVQARYRTIKLRDKETSEWKTYFIYRWPNYRGQGYDASLIKQSRQIHG